MRRLALICLALLAACEHRNPVPTAAEPARPAPDAAKPPPEPIRVPPGCEINLRGRYRLLEDPRYRYRIEDDGAKLSATLDAGPNGTEGAPKMSLERTPKGFTGSIATEAMTAGGVTCPVRFPAEIVACDSGRVTVRSTDAIAVDDDCRLRPAEAPATDKVLVRE